jgi:shikimate dehydrogenase
LKQFGIIGNPLGHSYSKGYFTDKFARETIDAIYVPHTLEKIDQVQKLMDEMSGFNVTYPYKEAILPYLKHMDPVAQIIGAVNVVSHGVGYNTDWLGFRDSIRPLLKTQDKQALLLGTGGVSKAIQYALKELGIAYTLVSRSTKIGAITYTDVNEQVLNLHSIIINCTPLGMAPHRDKKPALPYHLLSSKHLLYDCIYNPAQTAFLLAGEEQGCRTKNGLEMLHLQADYAWQIWNNELDNNR